MKPIILLKAIFVVVVCWFATLGSIAYAGARDIGNGGFLNVEIEPFLLTCVQDGYANLHQTLTEVTTFANEQSDFDTFVEIEAISKFFNADAEKATASDFTDRAFQNDSIREFYQLNPSNIDELTLRALVEQSFLNAVCIKHDFERFL